MTKVIGLDITHSWFHMWVSYVCVCLYPCTSYVYTCTCVHMRMCVSTHVRACAYVCIYVCMYVCMYACMYICIYVSMYVCLHVCMYVCMCTTVSYMWVYVCMFAYVYINILCIDVITCTIFSAHTLLCVYIYTYVYNYACMYVCMYVYICACVSVHAWLISSRFHF